MAVEHGKNPIGGGSCNCGDGVNGCEAGVRASGGGQPCLVRGYRLAAILGSTLGAFSVPRVCTGTVVFAGLHHWMPELHRNRVPHRHKPLPEPNYGRDAAHSRLDDESRRHSRICAGLLPFQSLAGAGLGACE